MCVCVCVSVCYMIRTACLHRLTPSTQLTQRGPINSTERMSEEPPCLTSSSFACVFVS